MLGKKKVVFRGCDWMSFLCNFYTHPIFILYSSYIRPIFNLYSSFGIHRIYRA